MRKNSSDHYLRGIFFFFVTALILIVVGGLGANYIINKQNNDVYTWQPQEGDTQVLPVSSYGHYPVTEEGQSPFVAVVNRTRDAVVNIYSEGENPSAQDVDPMWHRFFGIPPKVTSYGSGFVIRPDGYILTNNHVVENGERIVVSLSDHRQFDAELVGADPQTDLAVLKIDVDDELPFIELGDSEAMQVGDWVIAIGNPFPEQGLDRTVTVGVVSAKSRRNLRFGSDTPAYQDYIQTDASINPGNSGGPLMNLNGQAIGINSAIASPNRGSVGIGFAIPSNMARNIVSNLIESGRVSRGWLGVTLAEVTPDMAEASGLDEAKGVLISEVINGSPASSVGLQPNDIVISFDGKEVPDLYTFRLMVAEHKMGDHVAIKYNRDGKFRDVKVVLGDRDLSLADVEGYQQNTPSQPQVQPNNEVSWLGMTVETASPQLAGNYKVEYHPGVIITKIEAGSPAYTKNLTPGTIITKIDFKDIRSKEDFLRISNELKDREKAIAFYVFDLNGNIGYVAIKP